MLERVADYIKRVTLPVSRVFGDIGIVAIVLMMLITVVAVCSRRFFNAPIRGALEITQLAFAIAVFFPMAWCTLKEGHVDMNVLTQNLPARAQVIIDVVMLLITTVMLGILSGQLFTQGARLQAQHAESVMLSIPMFPFMYSAALATLLMTLAFFIKFLNVLASAVRRPS